MSCCAKRQHNCDDAILDRLNGVDDIRTTGREREIDGQHRDNVCSSSYLCDSCWESCNVCRKKQHCCCDYCWLRSCCPYHSGDRDED